MYKKKTDGSQKLDGSTGGGVNVPAPAPQTIPLIPHDQLTGRRPSLGFDNDPYAIAKSPDTSPEKLTEMAYAKPGLLVAAAIIANPNTPDTTARYLVNNTPNDVTGEPSPILQRVYRTRRRKAASSSAPSLGTPRVEPLLFGEKPAGFNHMDPELGRCTRCDSRFCVNGCFAGEPGYVYVTGSGWVTMQAATRIASQWERSGVPWGPHHPYNRIEVVCDDSECTRCASSRSGQFSEPAREDIAN